MNDQKEISEERSWMKVKTWPLGGYAPGNYYCKCCFCGNDFTGDKRSAQCLECAIKMTVDALQNMTCKIVDYEEALEDKRRLTKEIGDILDGDQGAVSPSLCDLISPIRELKLLSERQSLEVKWLKDLISVKK
jgi:hypothetical protein